MACIAGCSAQSQVNLSKYPINKRVWSFSCWASLVGSELGQDHAGRQDVWRSPEKISRG